MKYLKKKPVRDLTGDQFLKLHMAAEDKLLEVTVSEVIEGNTSPNYLDELKQLYQKVRADCLRHLGAWMPPNVRSATKSSRLNAFTTDTIDHHHSMGNIFSISG